jgi:ABC-type dipeptide/oligopeptide/nickel transport system permease subunit
MSRPVKIGLVVGVLSATLAIGLYTSENGDLHVAGTLMALPAMPILFALVGFFSPWMAWDDSGPTIAEVLLTILAALGLVSVYGFAATLASRDLEIRAQRRQEVRTEQFPDQAFRMTIKPVG